MTSAIDRAKHLAKTLLDKTTIDDKILERLKAGEQGRANIRAIPSKIGQSLQKIPNLTVPENKYTNYFFNNAATTFAPIVPNSIKSQGLRKATNFGLGLVTDQVKSYGRTIENVSTSEGRQKLKIGFSNIGPDFKALKQGDFRLFDNPAVETAFNVADVIPLAKLGTSSKRIAALLPSGGSPGFIKLSGDGITQNKFVKRLASLADEDIQLMELFVDEINAGGSRKALGQLGRDVQNLADYLGFESTATNKTIAKRFEASLHLSDRLKRQGGYINPQAFGTKSSAKLQAREKLRNLLNYSDNLRRIGYSEDQIRRIDAREGRAILETNIPPWDHHTFQAENMTIEEARQRIGEWQVRDFERYSESNRFKKLKTYIDSKIAPLKLAPEDVQQAVKDWKAHTYASRIKSDRKALKLRHINAEDGWKIVQALQNPKGNAVTKVKFGKDILAIKKDFAKLRQQAIKKGIDVGFIDNYAFQVWKQPDTEVARALGYNPAFAKERTFKSYQEGMKLGLEPLYTHPGQLLGAYSEALEKSVANRRLFGKLRKGGHLVPSDMAPANWVKINAPFFPKASRKLNKETVILDYAAPPDMAKALNNIFELKDDSSFWHKAGNVSSFLQTLKLSAGVPGTPINSFAVANLLKEFTAGRALKPLRAFIRSFSDTASTRWVRENNDTLLAMRKQGLNIPNPDSYKTLYKNVVENKTIKSRVGDVFSAAFDKPTFDRFLPQMQMSLFQDSVRKGLTEKQAADVVKHFYGVLDDLETGRSKNTQDIFRTVFFAPKFRETMVQLWGNNFKAFTKAGIKDPTYALNRRFMAGTALSYAIYSAINKKITGHWMHENRAGKEFELEIPKGGSRSAYIPLLPSILTLPRRAAGITTALAKGDLNTAGQQASGFLSSGLQTLGEVASNRTFFGSPITSQDDTPAENFKAIASYLAEQGLPYVGPAFGAASGRLTAGEALASSAELPIRFSTSTINENSVRDKLTKAFRNNDLETVQMLMPHIEKYSISTKPLVTKALAQALKDKDRDAALELAPLAQRMGVKAKDITSKLQSETYTSTDRRKVKNQIVKALHAKNKEETLRLVEEAEAMGISRNELTKYIKANL